MSHAIDIIKRYYDLEPSGLIHVGAHNGQEVGAYKASGSRPVLLVEAQDGPYAKLVEAVDGEPGFHPIQACCSSVGGRQVDFRIASSSGQASSYLKPEKHLEYYPGIKFDESVPMTTSTLDEIILDNHLVPEQFEYLALDVQGAEMDILVGADKTLPHIKFAWLEVNFGGLYEGDTGLYPMIDFMRGRGFDLYFLRMGRKTWGDALFIRQGVVQPI